MENEHIKHCKICGRETPWKELKLIGKPFITEDETGRYETEMRNCVCGGTYAVERKLP